MIYVDKKAHGWGLEVLTQDEIQRIHDSACRVLRETGVYMASKDAQDYMEAFGCDVDRETNIIKIPQSVIDKALDAIPKAPAGSAEHALYSCATTQFAKFYGVGCSAGGG